VGLTGIPILDADETRVCLRDSTICSLLAVGVIGLLLYICFHGWQLPLLTVLSLAMAIAWTFGYLTLVIGHLQLLSIVFTVILLGLGIDFGIHLVSRFELVRHHHGPGPEGFRLALVDTMQSTGPGMLTGALTTAVAFGTTVFTDFRGVAEMGHIAGVGVLLCLLSMVTVLPALLRLFHFRLDQVVPVDQRWVDLHTYGWLGPLVRRPLATMLIALVVIVAAGWVLPRTRFDNNLTNLYPKRMPSIAWQQRISEHSDLAIWYGVSVTDDLEEARRRVDLFRALPEVADVGGVGMLWPADEGQKLEMIGALRRDFGDLLDARPRPPPSLLGRVTGADDLFHQLHEGAREQVRRALSPRPLVVEELPRIARRNAVSADGKLFLVKVYPREDIWDPAKLGRFVSGLRGIDPLVTGSPIQVHESGILMRDTYRKAGLVALVAVLLVVLVDFGSVVDAICCLLPVLVGFLCMFAVMWMADVPVNPANIIVLPLMFGIGVDSGVHIMHRFRASPHHEPVGLSHGAGKGVVLTSLTTIVGFAALMAARHRGIQSLGFVLAVGIALTLVACLTVMPAVLTLRRRRGGDISAVSTD